MNTRRHLLLLSSGLVLTLANACASHDPGPSDLATRASVAIPSAEGVKLTTPGTSGTSGAQSLREGPGYAVQGAPGGAGTYAECYRITRSLFDGVNVGTGWVLGTVLFVVHLPPTAVEGNVATWGPASEALDPADWRMVLTETAHEEFSYELQGRKKGAAGDFRAVLQGRGFGASHPKHGEGTFTLFYDVANELDPTRLGADKDTGTMTITHDVLRPERTISASARPANTQKQWDVTATRHADDSGTVHVEAIDALDASKASVFEHIVFDSHFAKTGAGRAKVAIDGGDVPAGVVVHADECWTPAPDFGRSFYGDDASLEPGSGDASSCVF